MRVLFAAFAVFAAFSAAGASAAKTEPSASAYETGAVEKAAGIADARGRAEFLEGACSDGRASAALFFNCANAFAQAGDHARAELYYKKAVGVLGTFYLARRNLAYSLFNRGEWDAACAEFARALALSGADSPGIFRALAKCHMESGRHSQALACIESAMALSAPDEELLRAQAVCLRETGQKGRLRALCGELLAMNPRGREYWRMLCALDMDSGDMASACADLEAMSALGISEPRDAELLAGICASLGMFGRAAQLYSGLDMPPERAYEIARAFALSGAGAEVMEVARSGIPESSSRFWEVKGLAEKASGKTGREAFEKSLKLDPSNAASCAELAEIALSEGEFELARTLFASAGGGRSERSAVGIANAEIGMGNFAEAARILNAAASEFSRPELASYASKLEEFLKNAKK